MKKLFPIVRFLKVALKGYFLISLFILHSCVPLRDIVYLQDIDDQTIISAQNPEPYRLQPDDNLYIKIISNDQMSQLFNLNPEDNQQYNETSTELDSYKINVDGNIEIPYLGYLKVSGLTVEEVRKMIEDSVSKHLIHFSVVVKPVNRSFTLLGEFNNPGTYRFTRDYLTIYEAIGFGNDFTDYANFHKVTILRNTPKGKIVTKIDFTSKEIISNEYFYLKPGDIIYAEPRNMIWGSKSLPFSAILTTINTAVLLYNAISYSFN